MNQPRMAQPPRYRSNPHDPTQPNDCAHDFWHHLDFCPLCTRDERDRLRTELAEWNRLKAYAASLGQRTYLDLHAENDRLRAEIENKENEICGLILDKDTLRSQKAELIEMLATRTTHPEYLELLIRYSPYRNANETEGTS